MSDVFVFQADDFLEVKKEEKYKVLEDFERKKRKQQIMSVVFTEADQNGNMSYSIRQQGVEYRIIMMAEDIAGANAKNIHRLVKLGKSYPVMVKQIDYEARNIYVSQCLAKQAARDKLVRHIETCFAEGRAVRTKARVAYIRKDKNGQHFLELDIAGVGLNGTLYRDEWSICYTSDVSAFAKVGDIIDVDIVSVLSPKSYSPGNEIHNAERKFIFRCSRKSTIEYNPWEGVEARYPIGATVTITCIDKMPSKFFAKIDGLEEINALCQYPNNYPGKEYIRVGGRYVANVKKVDEEKKVLIVRPYKELT